MTEVRGRLEADLLLRRPVRRRALGAASSALPPRTPVLARADTRGSGTLRETRAGQRILGLHFTFSQGSYILEPVNLRLLCLP